MLFQVSLRIASVLAVIHAVMHQIGMMQLPTDPTEIALTASMRGYEMNVMGSARSYMDFYKGMGTFMTIMLLCFAVVLWQISSTQKQNREATRPLLLTIGLAFLVFAATSIRYFFVAPVVMELLIAALALLAFTSRRSSTSSRHRPWA
jgi:heme A synthase